MSVSLSVLLLLSCVCVHVFLVVFLLARDFCFALLFALFSVLSRHYPCVCVVPCLLLFFLFVCVCVFVFFVSASLLLGVYCVVLCSSISSETRVRSHSFRRRARPHEDQWIPGTGDDRYK